MGEWVRSGGGKELRGVGEWERGLSGGDDGGERGIEEGWVNG